MKINIFPLKITSFMVHELPLNIVNKLMLQLFENNHFLNIYANNTELIEHWIYDNFKNNFNKIS